MEFIAAAYGLVCYAVSLASFLYSIGFVGNLIVPKSIDSHPGAAVPEALVVNLALLGLFAVQHSVMARPGFKEVWPRIVPRPVERSTYVLISSLLLALLYWKWQAIPAVVWDVSSPVLEALLVALFALGWLIVLLSTFMINHFDLFGLRQVYLRLRGLDYTPLNFTRRALYGTTRFQATGSKVDSCPGAIPFPGSMWPAGVAPDLVEHKGQADWGLDQVGRVERLNG